MSRCEGGDGDRDTAVTEFHCAIVFTALAHSHTHPVARGNVVFEMKLAHTRQTWDTRRYRPYSYVVSN